MLEFRNDAILYWQRKTKGVGLLNRFFVVVWLEALRYSQHFVRDVGTLCWVKLVLSNEDKLSSSKTQHRSLVRFEPATLRSRVRHSAS